MDEFDEQVAMLAFLHAEEMLDSDEFVTSRSIRLRFAFGILAFEF